MCSWPKQGTMVIKKRHRKQDFAYPADRVWAAACAAHRINAGYFKYPKVVDDKIVKPTNSELVRLYLSIDNCEFITNEDYQQGAQCQQILKNSVTMKALKGELSQWDLLVARMTDLETVETDYELNVIAALPKSHDQVIVRENTDSRLAHCDPAPVGLVNERVELIGEIVRSNYSNRFDTFYTTVITNANQQVFFAYREQLAVGQQICFYGRIKRHAGLATQLSRVKLLQQEVV